jgi:two-component system, chemotaxis family, sensor kinase CheA
MAKASEALRARLLATFRPEAHEHLEAIASGLLALEQGHVEGWQAVAEDVFRAFHTLKGAARSVSLMDVEGLAQACEAVFNRVKRSEAELTPGTLRALRDAVSGISRLVDEDSAGVDTWRLVGVLEAAVGGEPPARSPSAERVGPLTEQPARRETESLTVREPVAADTVRVPTARLDALLLQVEELLAPELAAGERLGEARGLVASLDVCVRSLERRDTALERAAPAALRAELRAASALARELAGRLRNDERGLAARVEALQSVARGLRMSPAASVLAAFPAMLRDLAESQGKEVDWLEEGTAVELDRKVIEAVRDPLIHLVRNAVDHGIETPDARSRAGKPRRGRVAVRVASLEGGRVEIAVEDDGAGVEPERVKAAAVRLRQLTQEQAAALSADQALDLVFRSGVSTAPVISALSGHGLGLAIARERAERLGGQVRLDTRPGHGTTVRMTIPASVASFSGLLVRASAQLFLLPTECVERVSRVERDKVRSAEGREVLFLDGQAVPFAPLSALLDLPGTEARANGFLPYVLVAAGGERMGLGVDEVLGEREVLVKELRPPLVRVRHVSGAGLLGSGELALILRPADLLGARHQARGLSPVPRPQPADERATLVLVVDDSITTRTMEKNLLEAAGYHVQVAVDGVEAWTALKAGKFDLVVSDVDMPRMDGFELTRRIRADRELAGLPVVLVTALESREDKERGIESGANAYVVKSSFDQSNLLQILARLA